VVFVGLVGNTPSIISDILRGISLEEILGKISNFKDVDFQSNNIKQELMVLHLREETVASEDDTTTNFISLFYFDQGNGNGRLLIVESALIVACRSNEIDFGTLLSTKEEYVK